MFGAFFHISLSKSIMLPIPASAWGNWIEQTRSDLKKTEIWQGIMIYGKAILKARDVTVSDP